MHNNQNYFDLEKREKLRHMQMFSDIFSYIINRDVEAGGVGGGGMASLADQLTLSQPERQIMPRKLQLAPSDS